LAEVPSTAAGSAASTASSSTERRTVGVLRMVEEGEEVTKAAPMEGQRSGEDAEAEAEGWGVNLNRVVDEAATTLAAHT